MENKKNKETPKPVKYKIVIEWDGTLEKEAEFKITYSPDPLKVTTDIRKLLLLLSNGWSAGVQQLGSVIKQLPQPDEEDLKNFQYDFSKYGDGDTFGLYNYKKAVLEEIASVVKDTLPTTFHDVLFVKGAQEKIFEKMRKELAAKKEQAEIVELENLETNKGEIN